jgi:hypothetical protein
MVGQVDRLWISDVGSSSTRPYSPDMTHAQRNEEDAIVRALRFDTPASWIDSRLARPRFGR